MKKFAVIGNPIDHSRSPSIHKAFGVLCGIDLSYERVLSKLDGFAQCVDNLRQNGFSGANVTVPFKQEAYEYVKNVFYQAKDSGSHLDVYDFISPEAREAQAVNTLTFKDGLVYGDNTDGIGLIRDIQQNCQYDLQRKNVLLLGAGGAAQGVLALLCAERLALITLTNRTKVKAVNLMNYALATAYGNPLSSTFSLKERFTGEKVIQVRLDRGGEHFKVAVSDWERDEFHPPQGYDVIINATSTGLLGGFESPVGVRFAFGALAYDMVYGKQTEFLTWAQQNGANCVDGWGMLVEQAAESFKIWHGVLPDTGELIKSRGQ